MAVPEFLSKVPSHFNWGIDEETNKEITALQLQLDEYLKYNSHMNIPALLFGSFIHVSKYRDPNPEYGKGREYLTKAYEAIDGLSNEEEKQGYLIVAKSNEAFMAHRLNETISILAAEIEDLLSKKTNLSKACIDSTRAFALSRVGLCKYDEAMMYYQQAVKVQPENTEWLFGLALVKGRCSRNVEGKVYSAEKEQERKLYEKIISLDKNHALAHVHLANNLFFKGEHAVAMWHACKAAELAPDNPNLLAKACKVFRRARSYRAALPIIQRACATGHHSVLFHEAGLLYRDMYKEQQFKKSAAIKKRQPWIQSDKSLIHIALEYFTKSIEANPTNHRALRDRALMYERLRMMKEADQDFIAALTINNGPVIDQIAINVTYAIVLQRSFQNEEKACERFRIAIDSAIKDCITQPVTPENPSPLFIDALQKDLCTARQGYKEIMEKKLQSSEPQVHSEGLKGLAWLHHVFGEHDSARARYEEYLGYEENRDDYEAIEYLIKSLILLGDFEEARRRIQELKGLQKTDLVKELAVRCALIQGEEEQTQGNHELAKKLFQEAVENGSMEGCSKMADILIKTPEVSKLDFRIDCARILHSCEMNHQEDGPIYHKIKKLMDVEHATYGKLHNWHLSLELAILENHETGITRNILDKASQTIYEARSMLDRVMMSFRKKHYPALQQGNCTFFHIQQDRTNQPKPEQQIKDEIMKRLKTYKWDKFDTKFSDLFQFLVEVIISQSNTLGPLCDP